MMKFLLITATILGSLPLSMSQYIHSYYVTPNISTTPCPKNQTCLEFTTYVQNSSYFFQSNTKFIFLSGIHYFDLGDMLLIQDKENISLVGSDNLTQHTAAEKVREYGFNPIGDDVTVIFLESSTKIVCSHLSGFAFSNISNLMFTNLTIANCGQYISLSSYNSSIHLEMVYNFLMDGVSIQNSTGYGLYGKNVFGLSHITGSSFIGNNQVSKDFLIGEIFINCKGEQETSYICQENIECTALYGGNIMFYYDDSIMSSGLHQLDISHTLFTLGIDTSSSNWGSGLSIVLTQSSYGVAISISRSVSYRNQAAYGGANFLLYSCSVSSNISLINFFSSHAVSTPDSPGVFIVIPSYVDALTLTTVKDSMFDCSSAGVQVASVESNNKTSYSNHISFENCIFKSLGDWSFNSIHTDIGLKNCSFSEVNQVSFTQFTPISPISIRGSYMQNVQVILDSSDVQIINSTFINSNILAMNTNITIYGDTSFRDKLQLGRGGALNLDMSTVIFNGSNVTFSNNSALLGGAVYVDPASSMFFIHHTTVKFVNNTAFFAGGAMYVNTGLNDIYGPCFIHMNCSDLPEIILYFEGNSAGEAGSVIYGGNVDTCYVGNCPSPVFTKIATIGENGNAMSLIASDPLHICGCNGIEINCSDFSQSGGNMYAYPGQTIESSLVSVGQYKGIAPTTILVYSVVTNKYVGSIRTGQNCSAYEVPHQLINETMSLITETAFYQISPFSYSYNITVTILPCPMGFVQNNESSPCTCDPLLQKYGLICNISDVTVLNTGNMWIGYSPQGKLVFADQCPLDYCSKAQKINVLNIDGQCSFRRSNVLCGQCKGNLSMTFGSSLCTICSNYYLLLIIPFAVMGVVLVLILFSLNLTVSTGALNGMIIYVNIIRINDAIFFQSKNGYSYFLSTLVAWFNLDFGIETCFYNGMDSYSKTWLQFVFPAYTFLLLGLIVLAARNSSKISRLCRYNAVPVLATLILLSYSKVLRTLIAIFSPLSLNALNSTDDDTLVWQYDGSIKYFGRVHIPLFIFGLMVAILLIIPYSIILLLSPCLQKCSHRQCFHWFNTIKPFMDSYQAPFKDQYHFWPGVQLFLRLPLYLVFTISYDTSIKMASISIGILLYLCFAAGLSVYKNWVILVLEISFLINLAILALLANTTNSSELAVRFGVTISALCILAIIFFHIYNRFKMVIPRIAPKFVNTISSDKDDVPMLRGYESIM